MVRQTQLACVRKDQCHWCPDRFNIACMFQCNIDSVRLGSPQTLSRSRWCFGDGQFHQRNEINRTINDANHTLKFLPSSSPAQRTQMGAGNIPVQKNKLLRGGSVQKTTLIESFLRRLAIIFYSYLIIDKAIVLCSLQQCSRVCIANAKPMQAV